MKNPFGEKKINKLCMYVWIEENSSLPEAVQKTLFHLAQHSQGLLRSHLDSEDG